MIELPNLSAAKRIGYDLETFDPYLIDAGPGWARGAGHIIGCALAVDGGQAWWIPIGERPDPNIVRYLSDTLGTNVPKVGANLQYDAGWFSEIGIHPQGLQLDVQFAEALLDDVMIKPNGQRRSFALDALAEYYLGKHKNTGEIEAYCKERWPRSKDFRENLWKCPVDMVGRYALPDASLPLDIMDIQWGELSRQELTDVFLLECRLIPLLVKMRRRGMPVNLTAAMEARDEMLLIERILAAKLSDTAGFAVNVNSGKDLEKLFKSAGMEDLQYTAKGNASFTADWLASCQHPIAQDVLELKQVIKARSTFIDNAIMDKNINGVVYPSLHPLRSDDSGTISGRFSCTQPNGQQIPKRNAVWAPVVRGMFCPEKGYPLYASLDLSQIEYRFFAHYSEDEQLIQQYQDPEADFHTAVAIILGDETLRTPAKTINFGLLYGMGKQKLIAQLMKLFPDEGNPRRRGIEIFDTYQTRFPAAGKLLADYAAKVISPPHEVRTILGRKSRFRLWEPNTTQYDGPAYIYNIAVNRWGRNIRIAGAYKAVNRLLQGSAADLMKKGMVEAFETGIFEKTGVPHITVHDELCLSYHPDLRADFDRLRECVENSIALKVPVKMGLATGPDWGHLADES